MALKFLSDVHATGGTQDSSGDLGSNGQVLSSTGSDTNWVNPTVGTTVIYKDSFTATNGQTAFTLANTVDSEDKTQVYIDGAYQSKGGYTVSGTTLTFDTGLAEDSEVEVITFSTATANNAASAVKLDIFQGDGSELEFELSEAVVDEKVTQVYINGVYQNKSTYSIDSDLVTLRFGSGNAPPNLSAIEVISFKTITSTDGTLTATTFLGDLNGTINTATTATTQSAGNNSTLVATTEFATTALNLKSNIASPTFTGTVGGITKAMVGLTNAEDTTDLSKVISTATQDALNLKSNIAGPTFTGDTGAANLTLSGYLRGPASFTIDPATHGDITGTVFIAGNLQVDGTTTTINSTTVSIDDLNFSIATDAADSAAANGAGITIGGAGASLTYSHSGTKFVLNKPLDVTGAGTFSGDVKVSEVNPLIFADSTSTNKASGIITSESGTSKWAMGSNFGSGDDSFNIYNYSAASRYLTISSTGVATFSGEVNVPHGKISILGGNNLTISGTAASHAGLSFATNAILPAVVSATNNNVVDLGQNGNVFKNLYLGSEIISGGGATFNSDSLELVGTTPMINIKAGASVNGRGITFDYNGAFDSGSLINYGATGETRLSGGASGTSGYFLGFYTDGSPRMHISSGGNVGIGVTPATNVLLHMKKDHNAATYQIIDNQSTGNAAWSGANYKSNSGEVYIQAIGGNFSGSDYSDHGLIGQQNLSTLAIYSTTDIRFRTGGTAAANEKLRISSGGAATFTSTENYSASGYRKYIVINSADQGGGGILWSKQSSTYNRAILVNQGNFYITRSTADDSSAALLTDFTINPSGNVGIGTTSPTAAKLTVMESALFSNSGSNGGYSYVPTKPIVTITTDGNGSPSGTHANNAVFLVGIGGGNSTSVTREHFRINLSGQAVFKSNTSGGHQHIILNEASSPYGIWMNHTTVKNNNSNDFIRCAESGSTNRFYLWTNGGIGNYQSNDSNLSDERVKKEISLIPSYWDKFKALEIVKFKYKDQTTENFNIGIIAQQVESVAPEFINNEGWGELEEGEDPLKSVYTADLYHATIKVLQEAIAKIESQQTIIEDLKSRIETLEG